MKRRCIAMLLSVSILATTLLSGCGEQAEPATEASVQSTEVSESTSVDGTTESVEETAEPAVESPMIQANAGEVNVIDDKYRTYYEVFVYSFYDSDDDGIGDIKGLTEKLDYINDGDDSTTDDLGLNGLWLMPIMPSTTYHKYDVIDYCDIDPEYGTLEDFKALVEECHNRDMTVIIDFVMNHTS